MGNVMAASGPSQPQFMAPEPPRPPPSSPFVDKIPDPPANDEGVNPGIMEDLHKRTKDVFPTCFEGIKVMLNKGLSSHFQVSHTIAFSQINPSGYRFGATYVGTKQMGPNEAFPILIGDIDPSGNMHANIIHQIGDRLRLKFASQFTKQKSQLVSACSIQSDYKGDTYSASFTLANPDIANESGVMVGQFIQSVTTKVALGAELAYQFGPQVPGGQIALLSLAGRYNDKDSCFSGTIGTHALHLCYYQKASEQLQVGCELETNFRIGESTATIGYQVDLPKIDLVFRGMLDSNWNVNAVLEKKLNPLPFTMSLSGVINHARNNYMLGFGFVIG